MRRGIRARFRRQAMPLLAGLAALALVAGGCGGGNGTADGTDKKDKSKDTGGAGKGEPTTEEQVELRFAWWGSDSRHEQTQEIIAAFEAEHPNITIVPDFTDWDSYWDKLATQTAGGDIPDIITHEERYLTDYALRGLLLDLSQQSELDLSNIDELALGGGRFDDGLFAVATGVNAYTIIADPQIFADAGVELPDDTTWTWDDYRTIARDISENTPDGVWGAQAFGTNEAGFNVWARQRGEGLYAPGGSLGFSAQTLADWWSFSLDMTAEGGTPPASAITEVEAGGPDQSLLATNAGAMGFWWTNQLGTLADSAGRELVLLRQPGESEGDAPGMYLKPAMFYSIAAQTEHPAEAAMFVDFLLNDVRAAEIMLTDRGLPANLEVREHILSMLPDTEKQVAEFMAEITPELADPPPPPPNGAGDVPEIVQRMYEGALFEQTTPEEAAEQFISEVETAISG